MSPPTPTPFNGSAMVCVVLYEDLDGNQKRSEEEYYMAGGVANLNNREVPSHKRLKPSMAFLMTTPWKNCRVSLTCPKVSIT